MPERRASCPERVQQVWDAISCVRMQKQIPSFERISHYMKRKHNFDSDDLLIELKNALKDDLLILVKRVGNKGSKQGIEQESYRLPDVKLLETFDGHDWYCFECHRSGDVMLCSSCHRVYHKYCLNDGDLDGNEFTCKVCKIMKSKNSGKIKKDELNLLLSFAANRLKEKTQDLHSIPRADEEAWRHQLLLIHSIDFNHVERKIEDNEYKKLEEFQADIQNIVHNVVIFYGVHSDTADMARQMLRDCICDLGDLKQCKDCYKMANEKVDRFWFCQPCNPPHELVHAKQKGFSYWPAKVLHYGNGIYDLKFFGGNHERAKVEKDYVKPISTNIQTLVTKRTMTWNRACEELRRHQSMLNKSGTGRESSEDNESDNTAGTSSSGSSSDSDDASDDDGSGAESEASRDESSISSSSKPPKKKQNAVNSDDYNVVSSSSQDATSTSRVNCSTQTPKRFMQTSGKSPNKSVQTDKDTSLVVENVPVNKVLSDFRQKIDTDHKDAKDKAVKELSARLQKEFEIEKQEAVRDALHKVQSQIDRVKHETEERLRGEFHQELEKLAEKHKEAISETKKKQWCYNCEVEAIYHCCWNTSYCSIDCQQVHWQREHKRFCRRKR